MEHTKLPRALQNHLKFLEWANNLHCDKVPDGYIAVWDALSVRRIDDPRELFELARYRTAADIIANSIDVKMSDESHVLFAPDTEDTYLCLEDALNAEYPNDDHLCAVEAEWIWVRLTEALKYANTGVYYKEPEEIIIDRIIEAAGSNLHLECDFDKIVQQYGFRKMLCCGCQTIEDDFDQVLNLLDEGEYLDADRDPRVLERAEENKQMFAARQRTPSYLPDFKPTMPKMPNYVLNTTELYCGQCHNRFKELSFVEAYGR